MNLSEEEHMTSVKGIAAKMLYWADLKSVCALSGTCITITLPGFHHGAQGSYSMHLKAAARIARQLLVKQSPTEGVDGLLAPIRDLAEDSEFNAGGQDRIIFRSPSVFRWFYLPGSVSLRTVVGRYCHVLPILNQLLSDREFYILGLNEKHLRLLHYADGDCEQVDLPDALPKTAEAAGAFDAPDHTLRDRSAVGPSSGSQSGVVFGTGSEREKTHERLLEFFRLVDQGLTKLLRGKPLLLSGVSYEVAIYRRASVYPFLMEGSLEGDLHNSSLQEIAHLADEQARMKARQGAEKQLNQLREMVDTERMASDVRRVLKAAEEGRVARLIMEERVVGQEHDSQEGLLNAAAALSIRSGAEVFMLPAAAMGRLGPIAAMLRY